MPLEEPLLAVNFLLNINMPWSSGGCLRPKVMLGGTSLNVGPTEG
jgi:hypothetical protein